MSDVSDDEIAAQLTGEMLRALAHHAAVLTAIGLRHFGARAAALFDIADLDAADDGTRDAVQALRDTLDQTRELSLDSDLAIAKASAYAVAGYAASDLEAALDDPSRRENALSRLRLLALDAVHAIEAAQELWCERRSYALSTHGDLVAFGRGATHAGGAA